MRDEYWELGELLISQHSTLNKVCKRSFYAATGTGGKNCIREGPCDH